MEYLTEANITTAAYSHHLMLVQFGNELCPACITMMNTLEMLERKIKKNRIIFAHVDIDESPLLEQKYNITCAPTLIIVKENKIVGRHVGQMTNRETRKFILDAIVANQSRL
jgi:thiol-disulfide isomerase/thioredoxin